MGKCLGLISVPRRAFMAGILILSCVHNSLSVQFTKPIHHLAHRLEVNKLSQTMDRKRAAEEVSTYQSQVGCWKSFS